LQIHFVLLQTNISSLNSREVEDVIDEAQKQFGGLLDDFQLLIGFEITGLFQESIHVPYDRV
jgi:hypothetical protein